MPDAENAQQEVRRLRQMLRDLVALSTLPAVWTGSDPDGIAYSLADVLLQTLSLDLIYVRLQANAGGVEVAMGKDRPDAATQARPIGRALEPWLNRDPSSPTLSVPNPLGSGSLRLAVVRFGHFDHLGVLAAGSQRADFPAEADRVLLGVAANQAAIVLQRDQSERAVREHRERLRVTLASIGDAVITTDTEGRITYLNAVAESLTGWKQDEAAGQPLDNVFRIVNEQTREPASSPATRALEDGVIAGLPNGTVLIRKDGTERPIDDSAAPIRDEHGHVAGCVLIFRDITERRRAEHTLARLAAIVESSDDAIVSKDLNGIITSWNAGAERMFGYMEAEAVGRSIRLIIPPERDAEEDEVLRRLRKGERIDHFETVRRAKDGRSLDISLTVSPVRDAAGRVIGASKTARDITERKRAEDRLRLLWEAAALLLSAHDPDAMLRELFAKIGPQLGLDSYLHYLVDGNEDALRLASCTGIADETARSLSPLDFGQAICGTVAAQRQPMVAACVQQSDDPKDQLAKSAGIRAYACNPLLSRGDLLGTLFFASRTKDRFDAGEIVFMETVCHYLSLAYERLRLLEQLREADRKKDEFLAMLAHELRNPLAPIRNAVHILNQLGSDEPRLMRARATIQRQVDHQARLLEELLDVTRISRGKITLRPERLDLTQLARDTAEDCRSVVEQAGLTFSVGLPEAPVWVEGDRTRLAQIVGNLLINAAKFTEAGGQVTLRLEEDREGQRAAMAVRDTGIGIAPEMLDRVFDPFAQVEESLQRSQGGLGLGLALVKGLTALHGGEVQVESAGLGQGARFTVQLPTIAAPVAAGMTVGPEAPSAGSARVLIVEDGRDAAETLRDILELSGHTVEVAYSGLEAVEAARRFRPEVVLCDLGLPGMNGYEVAMELRKNPATAPSYLVAVSGYGQEEDRQRSREAGFDRHLIKPLNLEEVQRLLLSLKRGSGAQRRSAGSGGAG